MFVVLNCEDLLNDFYVFFCHLLMNSYTACHKNQDKCDCNYLLILSSFRVDSFIAFFKKMLYL
jgi:hypothetical protein